ncbi:LIM domain binding 1 [Pitangus sulphuratus]|nr:LIM domain binding 1 [Pitangus sulphuratus]
MAKHTEVATNIKLSHNPAFSLPRILLESILQLPLAKAIGRTLIPRYFSTVFEGGVTDLYYILKHSKESYHNSSITVDCDQCTMVTQHGKPMFTKVCTEGRLILEFTFDDLMRIKTWHFTIRQYRELVPRSILAMHAQDPQVLEQLSKNITRMGLTNFTLNYLRDVMVVGEPTLMGGEFGDEDERLITRLENTQYDAANGMDDEEDFNNSPALGNNSPWNSKPPANQETKSENPTPQASQ